MIVIYEESHVTATESKEIPMCIRCMTLINIVEMYAMQPIDQMNSKNGRKLYRRSRMKHIIHIRCLMIKTVLVR